MNEEEYNDEEYTPGRLYWTFGDGSQKFKDYYDAMNAMYATNDPITIQRGLRTTSGE